MTVSTKNRLSFSAEAPSGTPMGSLPLTGPNLGEDIPFTAF